MQTLSGVRHRDAVVAILTVAAAGILAGIGGCDSSTNPLAARGQIGGYLQPDNEFSDAPTSPGGEAPGAEVVEGEQTQSFFTAIQIDPVREDTAGPKFVIAADIDQDGLLDLISAWNESQPVQLHLQRRAADGAIWFRSITLAGTFPISIVAGVEVGQINDDGWLDIVVLVKATGEQGLCPPEIPGDDPTPLGLMVGQIMVYFNPADPAAIVNGDNWNELTITMAREFPGLDNDSFDDTATYPENNGFTALAVGQVDGQLGDDIVVAFNAAMCKTLGQDPPINTFDLYVNPGGDLAHDDANWDEKVVIDWNLPEVKDVMLVDIDQDGDLDVVGTRPNAVSANIRWYRNPLIEQGTVDAPWDDRPIGQLRTEADVLAMGDMDGDGYDDVIVRSTTGGLIQWFRRPGEVIIEPEFPGTDPNPNRTDFPWPVFTLTEFELQSPEAIAVGDLTGDGQVDLVVAAEGAVRWFDGTTGASLFDEWAGAPIFNDSPNSTGTDPAAGGLDTSDPDTHINTLLIVDLDGDGRNDIVATLDRRTLSGLTNDSLVWYRNIRTEDNE